MIRARRARIVATLGPASREAGKVVQLASAGADVFRVNFSHGLQEDHARTIANVRAAASLFMTDDPRIARQLADEKVHFRDAVAKATEDHFMQLRPSSDQSAEASALHLDLMRDLKVINSHIVAAIAYPVLERMGELLPSRLATTEHSH